MVYFSHFILIVLKVNYPVNMKYDLLYVLVLTHVSLTLNLLKVYSIFIPKYMTWLKITPTVGGSSHIRRLEMVIFCGSFCKTNLTIILIKSYRSVLSWIMVEDREYIRPIILRY